MEQLFVLKENIEVILPADGLEQKLEFTRKTGKQLVVKLGFDPTAPDLHLGHAVVLKKLRQFQELGHEIVIVVGSFTARIGDPTGKNKSRRPLSAEEVQQNAATYIQQLGKVIDVNKAKIVLNSDWLDALPFSEVIRLLSLVSVAQLMQRHDFRKRFTENSPIAMHELMYPILQGFDSVQINADIEMGGTDQLFNCTMGRQLQEASNMEPQVVLCLPLLKGIDGKEKMSKSLNNTIGLTDSPEAMFGKAMSIPDSLIVEFLDLTTNFNAEEKTALKDQLVKGDNPMNIKKIIAKNIITQYHSVGAAVEAEQFFVSQFQQKQFDEKIFELFDSKLLEAEDGNISLLSLCHQLKPSVSRSAIRRLIEEGGVQVNSEKITDPLLLFSLEEGLKIKIGRRDYFELF